MYRLVTGNLGLPYYLSARNIFGSIHVFDGWWISANQIFYQNLQSICVSFKFENDYSIAPFRDLGDNDRNAFNIFKEPNWIESQMKYTEEKGNERERQRTYVLGHLFV